ncbi:hypothetical protein ES703_56539 [subsurface metagenome]
MKFIAPIAILLLAAGCSSTGNVKLDLTWSSTFKQHQPTIVQIPQIISSGPTAPTLSAPTD